MQIRVEKKENQYYIFINGESSCSYFGYWENRWGYLTVTVLTIYNQKRLEISNRYSILNPFRFDYDLLLWENNQKLKLKPSALFKGNWQLDFAGHHYDFIKSENKRTLNKNGIAVATYNCESFPFSIESTTEENLFILLAFALAGETGRVFK